MQALLLYPDREFDLAEALPPNEAVLTRDLDLRPLLDAMAGGDAFLFDVGKKVLLRSLTDIETIEYRQSICRDCMRNPSVIAEMYRIAVEAIEQEGRQLRFREDYAAGLLSRSRSVIEIFLTMLRNLRQLAENNAATFESKGFVTLFEMLKRELDDDFFAKVSGRLEGLKFRNGVLLSAALGPGNKGIGHVLRGSKEEKAQGWFNRLFGEKPSGEIITITDRDESEARALSDLRDQALRLLAGALSRSAERILGFFQGLRTDLAFYQGCLNLHAQLSRKGEPITFPLPSAVGERKLACRGIYDVSMALSRETRMVGNDLDADGVQLIVVTGANQGGKSAFLRGVGQSQRMMQSGMFVPAEAYSASLSDGVFTHFRREEDVAMNSGKFDEELKRMSGVVDALKPGSMLLFNESFAASNEREGSEVASQIVRALLDGGIRMVFVTHLHEFAHSLYEDRNPAFRFLIAERREDGERTFKLIEGEPSASSFGKDLYAKVFGSEPDGVARSGV